MVNAATLLNIDDVVAAAKKRLPRLLFDFIRGGIEDEVALRRNYVAYHKYTLVPRVLVNIAHRDQSIELFGKRRPSPLIIGPTGPTGFVWYKGEIALAKAAAAARIPFTLSSGAATPMEEVVREAGGDQWFQLYMSHDRERSYRLLERVESLGYEALVLTVDSNIPYQREADIRNGFRLPVGLNRRNFWDIATHPRWLATTILPHMLRGGLPSYPNFPVDFDERGRPLFVKNQTMIWDDIDRLRRFWPRKLLLKGILNADDAERAIDRGVDGIVVSNHAAGILDSAPAPLDVLPAIVKAVKGRITIIVDGGVRRGSDIVKAIALGADAVMIGRATLFGTAAAGEIGAARVLSILSAEIDRVLGMIGVPILRDLGPNHIVDNGR